MTIKQENFASRLSATRRAALLLMGTFLLSGTPISSTPSAAAEVKTVALMTLEPPTDFGWNQAAADAMRAVAEKKGVELILEIRSATATFVRLCVNSRLMVRS